MLKMGLPGLSESTLVKMPHCWKSHVTAQITSDYHQEVRYNRVTHSSCQGLSCLALWNIVCLCVVL